MQPNPSAGTQAPPNTGIETFSTIAVAQLEIDNWTGHRFTDLFTLLNVGGEWKILNKVFHLHG